MTTVLVTGAQGFIAKNLRAALNRRPETTVICFDRSNDDHDLKQALERADFVFHLAGVNRPPSEADFLDGNTALVRTMTGMLKAMNRRTPILFASSTHAAGDTAYGKSKRCAEEILHRHERESDAPALIFRLPGVFGKWARPNYNTVVATFCHNIARALPISISDPERTVELVYIDDVVSAFLSALSADRHTRVDRPMVTPTYTVTLKDLADRLYALRDIRHSLIVPDLADELNRKLNATFVSYLDPQAFSYGLEIKRDNRGQLAEVLKSANAGQVFISRSHPGVVRGNHFHHTKVEKFLVLEGEAVVRFRGIFSDDIIEHAASGSDWRVIDIPPGYTHNIENVGGSEMIVLFWANEMFDAARPDTYPEPV
jgi:UDP-2-acetamido-2,6-beta-L-arabino-hexul-4-ose reductase